MSFVIGTRSGGKGAVARAVATQWVRPMDQTLGGPTRHPGSRRDDGLFASRARIVNMIHLKGLANDIIGYAKSIGDDGAPRSAAPKLKVCSVQVTEQRFAVFDAAVFTAVELLSTDEGWDVLNDIPEKLPSGPKELGGVLRGKIWKPVRVSERPSTCRPQETPQPAGAPTNAPTGGSLWQGTPRV